ncbi:MAG TPA: phosphatidylserine decarboxylase, partial [Campylobacterales bacterium]|nr:phosphatidylserine decarboxylase [Campylobacterales bacterium]
MNKIIKAAWTNGISRGFGKFASYKFPALIQHGFNAIYVKTMGVDMSNFHPLNHYETLNLLFTRELLYAREMPKDPTVIVSPADSLISELGDLKESTALQIKDFQYCIKELLTEHISDKNKERVIDGK